MFRKVQVPVQFLTRSNHILSIISDTVLFATYKICIFFPLSFCFIAKTRHYAIL